MLEDLTKEPEFIAFVIDGLPIPKGRPRMSRSGHAFTPAKTRKAEQAFQLQANRHKPEQPLLGNIKIELAFNFAIPKSYTKKKKEMALLGVMPVSRADLDNLIKMVCDAMNKVFFKDDRQIVSIRAEKLYSERNPYTYVKIIEVPYEREYLREVRETAGPGRH